MFKGQNLLNPNSSSQVNATRQKVAKKRVSITLEMSINEKLCKAVSCGDTESVKIFLKEGASIKSLDYQGNAPLHLAIRYGHNEVVKFLIKEGADVENNKDGNTPLHLAARYGHDEIVKTLIEAGADIRSINFSGNTPLHLAVSSGSNEVVKTLIEMGVDIETKNHSGNTPLYLAITSGNNELIKILVKAANTDIELNNTIFESSDIEVINNEILVICLDDTTIDNLDVSVLGDQNVS